LRPLKTAGLIATVGLGLLPTACSPALKTTIPTPTIPTTAGPVTVDCATQQLVPDQAMDGQPLRVDVQFTTDPADCNLVVVSNANTAQPYQTYLIDPHNIPQPGNYADGQPIRANYNTVVTNTQCLDSQGTMMNNETKAAFCIPTATFVDNNPTAKTVGVIAFHPKPPDNWSNKFSQGCVQFKAAGEFLNFKNQLEQQPNGGAGTPVSIRWKAPVTPVN
jgi:hypothetical protein